MTLGIMEVSLVDAHGLKNTEFLGGGIDPYVVIQYRSQTGTSSIAQGKGTHPTWNEKFRFRVEYPGQNDQYKLLLKIMDHDTFSADDSLGLATVYIKDVLALGVENGIAELPPQKYRVVGADQNYCGDVIVGITFTPKVQEEADEEDFGGWKESGY